MLSPEYLRQRERQLAYAKENREARRVAAKKWREMRKEMALVGARTPQVAFDHEESRKETEEEYDARMKQAIAAQPRDYYKQD